MVYKVNLMQSAEDDLNNFIEYLLFEKKNEQAVIDGFIYSYFLATI